MRGFLLVPTVPRWANSTPTFEHELVFRTPQLVRSTCDRCSAFIFGRYSDGSLEKWEREHECNKTVVKVTLLRRLGSWLSH